MISQGMLTKGEAAVPGVGLVLTGPDAANQPQRGGHDHGHGHDDHGPHVHPHPHGPEHPDHHHAHDDAGHAHRHRHATATAAGDGAHPATGLSLIGLSAAARLGLTLPVVGLLWLGALWAMRG